jgi:hypothetical protein
MVERIESLFAERPEAIDAGFAHLAHRGPAVGELGRRLINDTEPPTAGSGHAARGVVTVHG